MKSLKDKYCIVGVGETEYSRNSGRTTRAMAVDAIRKAMVDAGLAPGDVDGMIIRARYAANWCLLPRLRSPSHGRRRGLLDGGAGLPRMGPSSRLQHCARSAR